MLFVCGVFFRAYRIARIMPREAGRLRVQLADDTRMEMYIVSYEYNSTTVVVNVVCVQRRVDMLCSRNRCVCLVVERQSTTAAMMVQIALASIEHSCMY